MTEKDGWYVPWNDKLDFEHYFKDGKSLCGKFKLTDKDMYCLEDDRVRVSKGLGICPDCANFNIAFTAFARFKNRERTGKTDEIENIRTGDITRMVQWLEQLDKDFTTLNRIYAEEGVCPYPDKERNGCIGCFAISACNLGDPNPRLEAHEHLKKCIERINAWM